MIVSPYKSGQPYDDFMVKIIESIRTATIKKNDDFLMMCVGMTNTGKSSLMLHAMDQYLGDAAHIKYIGLDRAQFTKALMEASGSDPPKFCGNDEANISKRESQSRWNRAILDLYYSIRGENIFHWWNNPSLDIIDKRLIEEVIKGCIFIANKAVDRPRIYYFFRREELLRIQEKHNKFTLRMLKKIAEDTAYARGWFRQYDGPLYQDYLKMKETRTKYKIGDFFSKWGGKADMKSANEVAATIGVSHGSVRTYAKKILFKEGEVIKSPTNVVLYSQAAVEKIENAIREAKKNT